MVVSRTLLAMVLNYWGYVVAAGFSTTNQLFDCLATTNQMRCMYPQGILTFQEVQ